MGIKLHYLRSHLEYSPANLGDLSEKQGKHFHQVGIIGGSGFDDPTLFENRKEVEVMTPFGSPSDVIIEGVVGGVPCALLARHGRKHQYQPSDVNYRANIWALKTVGCTHILATTATGSLQEDYEPGHLVVLDDFIDRYIYLGQLMTPKDTINKEIERRITNSWKKDFGMKEVMKDKNLLIANKSKLFNICILPVLVYESETWPPTRNITNKLWACQRATERSMVGINSIEKVRNVSLRHKTKVQDITERIRKQNRKWAGHMIRGKNKWSKTVTQWYPRDGRTRGRPQKRGEDDVRQIAGITWGRVVIKKSEWRRLGETFVAWQMNTQK
ncbi:S-methyl-5'-thioadenosine phosphorylase [Eumeta japonica]|uniref:S-methyl-5'-thioadenosine phosphorylase n=1 Tax=Eumeta variegata TaxID=151549 RepID=A0A4C1VX16_EUMVA|nr:S-methyl-5'-thioadenosine phosphorylase [Eumeta japonica]